MHGATVKNYFVWFHLLIKCGRMVGCTSFSGNKVLILGRGG